MEGRRVGEDGWKEAPHVVVMIVYKGVAAMRDIVITSYSAKTKRKATPMTDSSAEMATDPNT